MNFTTTSSWARLALPLSILLFFSQLSFAQTNNCRVQDSLQLVNLYNATGGANWTIKWNLSQPISTWDGITLNTDGCVQKIYLSDNNLVGTLPNLNMPALEEILIRENTLIGPIPNFNLPNLITLTLYNNQLNGAIPNFNLPNLKYLNLYNNQLSGTIPNFNLPNLWTLNLLNNQLTGTIPNFNLPNLWELSLQNNQLSGLIPNLNLPNLRQLNLSFNQLSGTIPNLSLPNLIYLSLFNNQLSGTIPNINLPNIQNINFKNNQLSGCIPSYFRAYCGIMIDITNNPNLLAQDFTSFCDNNIGACEPLILVNCTSKSQTPWNEWISNTSFSNLNNTSTQVRTDRYVNGFSDWTDKTATVLRNQTYPLSITPGLGFTGYQSNLYFRAWIDYNNNGIYEDTELVLQKNSVSAAVNQSITIPTAALVGTVKMRVSMKKGAYPTACEIFSAGEVEDYSVVIQGGAADPCLTDAIPPVFTNCPTNMALTTTGTTAVTNWTAPTATDNCATPSVSSNYTSGSSFGIGTTVVTYTATDAKNNTATCSFSINVVQQSNNLPDLFESNLLLLNNPVAAGDTLRFQSSFGNVGTAITSPTVPFHKGIFLSTDAVLSANDLQISKILYAQFTVGFLGLNSAVYIKIPSTVPPGLYYVISKIDVDDVELESSENNNIAVSAAQITVTSPVTIANCTSKSNAPWSEWIANVTLANLNNASSKTRDDRFVVGYSDWTDKTATVSKGQTYPLSITPGLSWPGYQTPLYFRAWIDLNNNGIYEDTELVLEKNSNSSAVNQSVTIPATAFLGTVKMRVSMKKGAYATACESFDLGEVEDYSVTISNGTVDPCATDVTPPVLANCPQNIVLTNATTQCQMVSFTPPTATDNCTATPSVSFVMKRGSQVLNFIPTTNADLIIGLWLVNSSYEKTIDNAGNVLSTVTLPPSNGITNILQNGSYYTLTSTGKWELSTDGSKIIYDKGAVDERYYNILNLTTIDWKVIGPYRLNGTPYFGNKLYEYWTFKKPNAFVNICPNVPIDTVLYTATDSKGNQSTCSFSINVSNPTNPCSTDATPPVLSGVQPNVTVNCWGNIPTAIYPTASDNCSTVSQIRIIFEQIRTGLTLKRTWTATDIRGNATTATQTITVLDNIAPVFTGCPQNISVTTTGTCEVVPWNAPASVSDNCGAPDVTYTPAVGTCFPVGTHTVAYVATDGAGNQSTCSFTITVNSNNNTGTCKKYTASSTNSICNPATWQPYLLRIGADRYVADNLEFKETSTGTATLKGTLRSPTWQAVPIDLTFSGKTTTGTPQKINCLTPSVSTANWAYYPTVTGTIGLSTGSVTINTMTNALQIGTGANTQNINDLGGYAKLQNGTTAIDLAFKMANETIVACESGTNSCANNALNFDGFDDYLLTPLNLIAANTNFTIEASFTSTATSTVCTGEFKRLLTLGLSNSLNRFEIGDCAGQLTLFYSISGGTSKLINIPNATTLRDGNFHHVAAVKTGDILTIYYDGVLVLTEAGLVNINNAARDLLVGRWTGSILENWKGNVDEVRVWNYAVSATDITNRRNCQLTGTESGLILYAPLNQGVSGGSNTLITSVIDKSPSNLTIALSNFGLQGSSSNFVCSTQTLTQGCTSTDPCANDITPPVITNCPQNIVLTNTTNQCQMVSFTQPMATDNCTAPPSVSFVMKRGSQVLNFTPTANTDLIIGLWTVNSSYEKAIDNTGNVLSTVILPPSNGFTNILQNGNYYSLTSTGKWELSTDGSKIIYDKGAVDERYYNILTLTTIDWKVIGPYRLNGTPYFGNKLYEYWTSKKPNAFVNICPNIPIDSVLYTFNDAKGNKTTCTFGINVSFSTTCTPSVPSKIFAKDITATTATLVWTKVPNAVEYEYQLTYDDLSQPNGGNLISSGLRTDTFATVSLVSGRLRGLVRSRCTVGGAWSAWSNAGLFNQLLEVCTQAARTSFVEDFESGTVVTSQSFNLPSCWNKITYHAPTVNESWVDVRSTSRGTLGNATKRAIFFRSTPLDSSLILLVTPEIANLSAGTNRLRFKAANTWGSELAGAGRLQIGTLSNIYDGSTFVPFGAPTVITDNNFREYTVDFTTYSGTQRYIAFRYLDAGGDFFRSLEIDDVVWETKPVVVTSADIELTIVSNPATYRQWTTNTVRVTAKNIGTSSMTNVKIDLKRPAKMSFGGTRVASLGFFSDYCAGGIECSEWTIPTLAAGATATLDAPFFVLDAVAPIVVTTNLLASTPVDGNGTNNSASVSIAPAPNALQSASYKPTQLIPVVIQTIAPNPTDGELRIKLESLDTREVTFEFYNALGKVVKSETKAVEKGLNLLEFSIFEFEQGMYFVIPSTNQGHKVPTKFVKL